MFNLKLTAIKLSAFAKAGRTLCLSFTSGKVKRYISERRCEAFLIPAVLAGMHAPWVCFGVLNIGILLGRAFHGPTPRRITQNLYLGLLITTAAMYYGTGIHKSHVQDKITLSAQTALLLSGKQVSSTYVYRDFAGSWLGREKPIEVEATTVCRNTDNTLVLIDTQTVGNGKVTHTVFTRPNASEQSWKNKEADEKNLTCR